MSNYFKYLKQSFSPLELNNEGRVDKSRNSHPLELFFDLVFVVALGKVGHVFLHPDIKNVIVAVILFLSVYQIWKNITKFNAYFFKQGLLISFLFLIVMLPVFFIASIPNYKDPNNIYLLIVSFGISRLFLTLAWYKLVYKNKLITNNYIKKLSRSYSIMFGVSTVLILLSLLNYKIFFGILVFVLFWEIAVNMIVYDKLKKSSKFKEPQIDSELLQERRLLFVILIWGEALVTAGSVFSEYSTFQDALLMSLALFFIIGFFFIRAVVSLGDVYNSKAMSPLYLGFTDYTFSLISLSLFVCVAGIASSDYVSVGSKSIVIFDLLYINTSHFYINTKEFRKVVEDKQMQEFVIVDNVLLIIQFIITFILIFINSTSIFVYFVLIIFIFHVLAVPIRYGKTEYF